jgi:hypothetical protein
MLGEVPRCLSRRLRYTDFVHATTGNIHPPVGRRAHIPHRPSAGGNRRPRELFRPWIKSRIGFQLAYLSVDFNRELLR